MVLVIIFTKKDQVLHLHNWVKLGWRDDGKVDSSVWMKVISKPDVATAPGWREQRERGECFSSAGPHRSPLTHISECFQALSPCFARPGQRPQMFNINIYTSDNRLEENAGCLCCLSLQCAFILAQCHCSTRPLLADPELCVRDRVGCEQPPGELWLVQQSPQYSPLIGCPGPDRGAALLPRGEAQQHPALPRAPARHALQVLNCQRNLAVIFMICGKAQIVKILFIPFPCTDNTTIFATWTEKYLHEFPFHFHI